MHVIMQSCIGRSKNLFFLNLEHHIMDCISTTVESVEEVVSSPFDNSFNMDEFAKLLVLGMIFDDTPAQHGHCKRHFEVRFDSITTIVITSRQVWVAAPWILPILNTRIPSPRNVVFFRQAPS